MQQDYILEFFEMLDSRIQVWESCLKSPSALFLNVDLKRAFSNDIFFRNCQLRDYYCQARKSGISATEASKLVIFPIEAELSVNAPAKAKSEAIYHTNRTNSQDRKILFFVNGPRMLSKLEPVIRFLDSESIVVTDNVTAYENAISNFTNVIFIKPFEGITNNTVLEYSKSFQRDKDLTRSFDNIFKNIEPEVAITIDGCQTQMKIFAAVATKHHVPSICIQQGWPSFIHSAFRRMPYDYFFTWGFGFSEILKKANPYMECIAVGYIPEITNKGTHKDITFFLQSPLFLSTIDYMANFISEIEEVSLRFSNVKILFRCHPEFPIAAKLSRLFASFDNIENVSNINISEVFDKTKIAISHYSSCLMEGYIHGCIPISFDQTYKSSYNPDLDIFRIGRQAKTAMQLYDSISDLLQTDKHSDGDLSYWLEDKGVETLKNIKMQIDHIISKRRIYQISR